MAVGSTIDAFTAMSTFFGLGVSALKDKNALDDEEEKQKQQDTLSQGAIFDLLGYRS